MAERPIFVPAPESPELVKEVFLSINWHPGFAVVQKEKNIRALHEAAERAGFRNILEVSSKSASQRGQHLSAFYLKVAHDKLGEISLESAFQGSKVFEHGGPFKDLYVVDARTAKKDSRLKESGQLVAFEFAGFRWPLKPKTAFYDFLYARCIYPHREWAGKLFEYGGFSDIEFNPFRSINCQARSIALFLSLLKLGVLDEAVSSPEAFIKIILRSAYRPQLRDDGSTADRLFDSR
jgi:hypothetical protein